LLFVSSQEKRHEEKKTNCESVWRSEKNGRTVASWMLLSCFGGGERNRRPAPAAEGDMAKKKGMRKNRTWLSEKRGVVTHISSIYRGGKEPNVFACMGKKRTREPLPKRGKKRKVAGAHWLSLRKGGCSGVGAPTEGNKWDEKKKGKRLSNALNRGK